MERIRKSDFIDNCKFEIEKQRACMEVYNAIEGVVTANKDKQMNVRIARKIEDAICLPDSFSASVSIGAYDWYDKSGKRGINVVVTADKTPAGRQSFTVKIPFVIEKQKIDYEKFCEVVRTRKWCTAQNIESVDYAIIHLDDIIGQSKKLLVEMKAFYCKIPYCMRRYLRHCDIYEGTDTLVGIY